MHRTEILETANSLITGERADSYGDFREQMAAVAGAFTSLTDHEIAPREVSLILMLLKMRRAQTGTKPDNMIDLAGYAALHAEAFVVPEVKVDTQLENAWRKHGLDPRR